MDSGVIEIIGTKAEAINLFPETIIEEITQNIRTILTTVSGTVPLDRRFGINAEFIDEPLPRAMMKLSVYVAESIKNYEPRVSVMEVDFEELPESALDGRLFPKVKVKILDEYLT